MSSPRMLKVNSVLKEVLADEIERMSDGRLEFVSVTGVNTAPDLRHAIVYVDVLGEGDREDALNALKGAARRLQSTIARQVRIKYTPTLEFELDRGVLEGERIDAILRSLQHARSEEE